MQEVLGAAQLAAGPLVGQGKPSSTIPALARVNPHQFGIALATVDGRTYGCGDWQQMFSVQSVTKLFATALVVAHDGDLLWERVRRRPSAHRYDALIPLDLDSGIPCNPFVNAGALVVTDRLMTLTESAGASIARFIAAESGSAGVGIDPEVAADERRASHRNAAAAHLMAAHGNLHADIELILDQYTAQCAVTASCADLARAALFLARQGQCMNGEALVTPHQARRLNALMLTCGTYEAAGEVAYRIGLPLKSGIGGAVVAVVPGRGTVCAWSPCLDASGNSIAAMAAIEHLATHTEWTVF